MQKFTRKLSFVLVCLLIVSMFSFYAAATEIVPFSIPTVSSTKCSQCYTQMDFVLTEYEYEDVLVQPYNCPITEFWADGLLPHTHTYELRYDVYMCPTCGRWGQMLVSRTMKSCELSMSDGNR